MLFFRKSIRSRALLACLGLALGACGARVQLTESPIIRYADLAHPEFGASGMVASQNHLSSQVGADILADGGNAVDAAVAVSFAIAVVEPWMSGMGGCGYLFYYDAADHRSHAAEFGVRSSEAVYPADYPLVDGTGPDLLQMCRILFIMHLTGRVF